jgi:hypothetical protein
VAYGAAPAPYSADEVRTIFITGFPDDVKERELNNLLRFLPGYEVSHSFPLLPVRHGDTSALTPVCGPGVSDEHQERAGELPCKSCITRHG